MAARNGNGNGQIGVNHVASWVAVVLSLGSAFWAVANPRDDIKEVKRDSDYRIAELQKTINQQYVTIAEFREYMTRKDKDTDRIEKSIEHFVTDLVPRSEHMQHWAEQASALAQARESVAELRKDFTGSWNIGKQLDNMQKEIDQLTQYQTLQGSVQHVTVSSPPVALTPTAPAAK